MKLRIQWLALAAALGAAHAQDGTCLESLADPKSDVCTPLGVPPTIDGSSFLANDDSKSKDILGCCSQGDNSEWKPAMIGTMPQFTTEKSLEVLAAAKKAWNHGNGVWPQMSLQERIEKVEAFLDKLHEQRSAIINLLMWEIGKNYGDATAEFDRTIAFAKKVRFQSQATS